MNNLIVLNKNDNVGVTQFIIPEKTKIEGKDIVTKDPIPFGHKVCLKKLIFSPYFQRILELFQHLVRPSPEENHDVRI